MVLHVYYLHGGLFYYPNLEKNEMPNNPPKFKIGLQNPGTKFAKGILSCRDCGYREDLKSFFDSDSHHHVVCPKCYSTDNEHAQAISPSYVPEHRTEEKPFKLRNKHLNKIKRDLLKEERDRKTLENIKKNLTPAQKKRLKRLKIRKGLK